MPIAYFLSILMVTEKYKALIERFPLLPIKNDEHLDAAHDVAQSLMLREEPVIYLHQVLNIGFVRPW